MKLLDTTFLIDYEKGATSVSDYLSAHEDEEFVTSTVCLKEIAVGLHVIGSPTRSDLVSSYGWLQLVPFTAADAYRAGEIEASLHADSDVNSDRINALTGDILIAAVAAERGATVVTRNTADFESLGISVESY